MRISNPIIGKSPVLRALMRSIKKIAPTNVNVLILGETGVGKELVAIAIKDSSLRAEQPYIALNCAALSLSIIESELFGYCKGAFTGAEIEKTGILTALDGGTLFLDEVNSLPLVIQGKLLRFIESGEYQSVGAVTPLKSDVRIIAASNESLMELVKIGEFKLDLYFRLNVIPLTLPPLRERTTDINLLINHYLVLFSKKYSKKAPNINSKVITMLERYPWPGNVRELRNFCEYISIFSYKKTIEPKDMPAKFLKKYLENSKFDDFYTMPVKGVNWYELEACLIKQALVLRQGNYKEAAILLGITRDRLIYRVKKYRISPITTS